jgi:hypothetical protein
LAIGDWPKRPASQIQRNCSHSRLTNHDSPIKITNHRSTITI